MGDRSEALKRFKFVLSSEQGQELVTELEATWDAHKLIGATPEATAYNVGLRDAFKFIKDIQEGAFIDG
jgi:hypothetical protein